MKHRLAKLTLLLGIMMILGATGTVFAGTSEAEAKETAALWPASCEEAARIGLEKIVKKNLADNECASLILKILGIEQEEADQPEKDDAGDMDKQEGCEKMPEEENPVDQNCGDNNTGEDTDDEKNHEGNDDTESTHEKEENKPDWMDWPHWMGRPDWTDWESRPGNQNGNGSQAEDSSDDSELQPGKNENGQTDSDTPQLENGSASAYAKAVVALVNEERDEAGLSSLTMNSSLCQVAQKKAEDMRDRGYFSHTSPTYGSPFEMMKQFGISYSAAGENIAKGQKTPESVMTAWMNSSGHRANILSISYDQNGVGYCTDASGTTYWVQMFIK